MRLEVLTKDGLTYYHNKLKNTFVQQSNLNTAIGDYLDTVDWVAEIGDAYVTPEQVADIISQTDLDDYMPLSGGTFTGEVNGVTPTSGDNSTKLATTAYVQGALSGATPTSIADTEIEQYWTGVTPEQVNQFLPLSGGTMSGSIIANAREGASNNNVVAIKAPTDSDIVYVYGGSTKETGARFSLNGKDKEGNDGGAFSVIAADGTNECKLQGKPTGDLLWGNVLLTDGTFLTVRSVSLTVSSNPSANIGSVTAPSVSGYQFIAWIAFTSNGAVFPCYGDGVTNTTTTVWIPSSHLSTAASRSVVCWALYVRKW